MTSKAAPRETALESGPAPDLGGDRERDHEGRNSYSFAARHRERLRRFVVLTHALIVTVMGTVCLATGVALGPGPGGEPAHLTLACALWALATVTAIGGERRWNLLLAVPVAIFAALPAFQGPGDVSSALAFTACALSAVRVLEMRQFATVVAVTMALMIAVRHFAGGDVSTYPVGSYLLALVNAYLAGAFVNTLERSTRAMDQAAESAHAENLRLATERARQQAIDGARRILHDEVLNALRAIAAVDPGTQHATSSDSGAAAVRASRQALMALDTILEHPERPEHPPCDPDTSFLPHDTASPLLHDSPQGWPSNAPGDSPPDSPHRWLEDVTTRSPLPLKLHVDLGEEHWRLDARQRDAAGRAVLEALRNAHRHARVGFARLSVTHTRDTVRFRVQDHGPGFTTPTESFGIRESILRPVTDAGGRAEILANAHGTVVDVIFEVDTAGQPSTLRRTYELTTSAGGHQRLAADTLLPLAVTWTAIGLSEITRSTYLSQIDVAGAVAQLAVLAGCSLITGAVAFRLTRRAPTTAWLAAVLAALLGSQVAGLIVLPAGAMLDLRSWPIGYLSAAMMMLCFVLPVRRSLVLIAANVSIIVVAAALQPALSGGTVPIGSINSVVLLPAITLLLGAGLRRNAVIVEADQATSMSAAAELLRRRSTGEVTSSHLEHTLNVVAPWLRRIADGDLDPTVAHVRKLAWLRMHEVRDDLHAPGFFEPASRRLATDFRAVGGTIDIRAGFEDSPSTLAVAVLTRVLRELRPLDATATGAVSGTKITVIPDTASHTTHDSSHEGSGRLVLVPAPPGPVLEKLRALVEDDHRLRVSGDSFALTLEFRNHPGATAPITVSGNARGGRPKAGHAADGIVRDDIEAVP